MNLQNGYDSDEAEYYYVNAVRAAEKSGTLDQLPTHIATDPVERDRALKIEKILSRRSYSTGDPDQYTHDDISICVYCHKSADLVKVTRITYSQPRVQYGVCAKCS